MVAIAEDAYFKLPKSGRDAFNVVLLYGTDSSLVAAAQRRIALEWPGDEEPVQLKASDLRSDPAALESAYLGMSLFGGRRLIFLEGIEETHAPLLRQLFASEKAGNYVVLSAGNLNKSSTLRSAAESSRHVHSIVFFEETESQLSARAARGLQSNGLLPDEGVGVRLAMLSGGDRSVLEGEVEKLALYLKGADRVTLVDVDALSGNASAFDASDLLEAMIGGDLLSAERAMSAARDNDETGQMLMAIKWQLDRMQSVRLSYEQSNNWEQAFARARPPVFFKVKDRWKALLSRVTAVQLDQLQRRLHDSIFAGRSQAAIGDAIAERFVLAATREMRASQR